MKKTFLIISLALICIVGVVCYLFYNGTIELPNSSNVDIQIEENNKPLLSNEILNSKAPETEKEKEDLYNEVKAAVAKKYDEKSIYSITEFVNFENSKNIIEKEIFFHLENYDITLKENEYYIFPLGAKKGSKIANQCYIDFHDGKTVYRGSFLESANKEKFDFQMDLFGFKSSDPYSVSSFNHYKNLYFSLYKDAFFEDYENPKKVPYIDKVIAEKNEDKISIVTILPTNEKRVISEICGNKIYIYNFNTSKLESIINYNPKEDLIKFQDSLNKINFEKEKKFKLFEEKVFEAYDGQKGMGKTLILTFEHENSLTNQKNEVSLNIDSFSFKTHLNDFKLEISHNNMPTLFFKGKYQYYPRLTIDSFETLNVETGKKLFYEKNNLNMMDEYVDSESVKGIIKVKKIKNEIFLDENDKPFKVMTEIYFNINYNGLVLEAKIDSLETNFNLKDVKNYVSDVERTLTITSFSQKVSGKNEYYSVKPVSFTYEGIQIEDNLINKIS